MSTMRSKILIIYVYIFLIHRYFRQCNLLNYTLKDTIFNKLKKNLNSFYWKKISLKNTTNNSESPENSSIYHIFNTIDSAKVVVARVVVVIATNISKKTLSVQTYNFLRQQKDIYV